MIGAILAGGGNTRFGGAPKGLSAVGGRRVLDRVADAMSGIVDEIILVANAPDATTWLPRARVVSDAGEARGSLIGLRTALKVANGSDVLIVAWDLPFVTRRLLELIQSKLVASVWAVVPESERGLEPCCAAYSRRCLRPVEEKIAAGEMRLGALVDDLPVVRRIGTTELASVGDPARLFFNVNSSDDLAAAERMAGGSDA